ncbi:MAG: tail fiber protein [Leptospiraceae bacterium]|nr:tail fiber protein [Leptospiraceae bacterium]
MSLINDINTIITNKLNTLIGAINQRRKISDSYSISETDNLLNAKRSILDSYSQTEIDNLLNSKINISDIIDDLLSTEPGKPLSANQGRVLKSLIDALIANTTGIPTGTVIYSAIPTTPTGFLICDGSELDRTVYSNLFSAIGTNFGTGNGSTTFNIPDLRGAYIRGTGTSIKYTYNTNTLLGQYINQKILSHNHYYTHDHYMAHEHSYNEYVARWGSFGSGQYVYYASQNVDERYTEYTKGSNRDYTNANSNNTYNSGDSENIPNTIGLNHFIKY